jgi:V/A-type H+-transporting ATPase subunit D
VAPSPELAACRRAFGALLDAAVPLAATEGNLERLSQEYRRSVRRARALQDVLLPESERALREVETALEELEQQDLVSMRHRPQAAAGAR